MARVEDTVEIARPAGEVFAALADPKVQVTYDEMFQEVEQLTPGAIGRGTRFRGRFKGMGVVEYSYDEFDQDRLIQHAVRMPFGAVRHRFELTPTGTGTRLAQSISLEANLIGKILWPLMMHRMMQRRVRTLNGLVKTHVESRA